MADVPHAPSTAPATLSCEEVAARMFDFVEGELDDHDHAIVERHLAECPMCAEFVRTYSAVGGLVRSALEVEVDESLQAELDAAIFGALAQSA